jgi:hypothetical protein
MLLTKLQKIASLFGANITVRGVKKFGITFKQFGCRVRVKLGRRKKVITLKRERCGDHAGASDDGVVVQNCVHPRQTGVMHEHDAVHELKVQRGVRTHVSFRLCGECREI